MSEYPLGSLRRENHGDGFSIWCYVRDLDDLDPMWRCIYSTESQNVGVCLVGVCLTDLVGIFADNDQSASLEDIGMLPGVSDE
jgi:hypothetical protein